MAATISLKLSHICNWCTWIWVDQFRMRWTMNTVLVLFKGVYRDLKFSNTIKKLVRRHSELKSNAHLLHVTYVRFKNSIKTLYECWHFYFHYFLCVHCWFIPVNRWIFYIKTTLRDDECLIYNFFKGTYLYKMGAESWFRSRICKYRYFYHMDFGPYNDHMLQCMCYYSTRPRTL